MLPDAPFDLPVVGVSFIKDYPQNLMRHSPGEKVQLRREPDNKFDTNAIGVWARDGKLGHLGRNMAKRLAKELDNKIKWSATISKVEIHPDHPDHPGLWVRVWRVGARS